MAPRRRKTKPGFATLNKVAKASEDWGTGQIECRALTGHNWKPYTARWDHSGNLPVIDVHQRCVNCKNVRFRTMTEAGFWVQSHWAIKYRKGYLMPKGSGRIDEDGKALLRVRVISSLPVSEQEVS
jgi:hypothetical protein